MQQRIKGVPSKPLQQMMISGRCIVMNDPHVDQIDISDIAYSLSRSARYAGNTIGEPYSVAQHSVLVADLVKETNPDDILLQLAALLHDAAEAPLIDIPYPVKISIDGFDELEDDIMCAIGRKFMVPQQVFDDPAIKSADWRAQQLEVRDLLPLPNVLTPEEYWGFDPALIVGKKIIPLQWQEAQELFITEFNDLWQHYEALLECLI